MLFRSQAVDQQGQIPAIVGEVTRRKALAALLESVTITDASGNPVDLDALVPGSDEVEDTELEDAELEGDSDVVDADVSDETDGESADTEAGTEAGDTADPDSKA